MTSPSAGLGPRGAAAIVFIAFVAVGLVLVFAGTLTRATELEAEAAEARAAVLMLDERLQAGEREIQFLESDRFVEQQARAMGYGTRDERAFALPDDAPAPPALPVLGEAAGPTIPTTPLDAWMELLFGG